MKLRLSKRNKFIPHTTFASTGKTCGAFQAKNHFAASKITQVSELKDVEDDLEILKIHVDSVSSQRDWVVKVKIAGAGVLLGDTAFQVSLLPYLVYKKMQVKTPLERSAFILRCYSGDEITHVGVITQQLALDGRQRWLKSFAVKKEQQVLLGLQSCERLGLISRNIDFKVVLREDAIPLVHAALPVPLALKEPLRDQLSRTAA
ncbi:hypothetical protein HPB47_023848 [Ixodes persulcatus]|uniref:Uncharacterized protein n=1 Tax=Ixodes persulcatus TaxID=34615 RepID=A0AC60Q735_IXOPE|nr:hypothetical protein HPB47_023848 [Ixodes persulcatus]